MRKIVFLLLLMLTMVAGAHDFEVDGIYYNMYGDNEVYVTFQGSAYYSYDNEYIGNVTIPETVTNNGSTYTVTAIGDGAFHSCSGLTSITIPNLVDTIGTAAFRGCRSLTSITIPNSVTFIGHYAFEFCSGLTSVTFGNSVTYIGTYAFDGCTGLTSITIPNSVKSIGYHAFRGCSKLETLNFNAISCEDFSSTYKPFDNLNITTINIGDNVQRIPARFAYSLDSLTNVSIGNSVSIIGESAFSYCRGLTSITIPNSVTSIGDFVFAGCI